MLNMVLSQEGKKDAQFQYTQHSHENAQNTP